MLKKSLFYRIYSWIAKIYGDIWIKINKYIKKISQTSFSYKIIHNRFKDDIEVIKTILTFISYFSMVIIIKKSIKWIFF